MITKNSLCIIPARSGSTRIPEKNIKIFVNRPIICFAIENAIASKIFDTIMVSTDSEKIANIAKRNGAEVPFMRSNLNSSNYAITLDVILEVIDEYKKQNIEYKYICCLYPCTPLLPTKFLHDGFSLIRSDNYDVVMPITKFPKSPKQAFIQNNNENIQILHKENFTIRTQDLEPMYYDPGQFYFFKTDSLIKYKQNIQIEGIIKPIIYNDSFINHDIDTIEDWKMAEEKYGFIISTRYLDRNNYSWSRY